MKYSIPLRVIFQKNFFLDKYDVKKLTDNTRGNLEGAIMEKEILEAISKITSGKSPGLDGFPIEFFKAFLSKLISPLLLMYNHAFEIGKLPESLELALITVLPKLGKDPKLCSSYRPISILTTDYKIFSKILALRLEKHIPDLINLVKLGLSRIAPHLTISEGCLTSYMTLKQITPQQSLCLWMQKKLSTV